MREGGYLSLGPHGFHRSAFSDWGDASNPRVLVCVHGLTRNGRDFDTLASHLSDRYRVICPDIPGRGRSDWLSDGADYSYPTYLQDMAALLAHLGVDAVDWIGTSMGGLIGMMLAAQPNTPIRRLVVNDVGPLLPASALERIAQYVGKSGCFASLEEVEHYLRQVHSPFGPLTDEQWRFLTHHSARQLEDGRWRLHYDPKIAHAFADEHFSDIEMWPLWETLRCPTLILRGDESDLLSSTTAQRMLATHPDASLVEFPGIGHAPTLMVQDQIDPLSRWLDGQAG